MKSDLPEILEFIPYVKSYFNIIKKPLLDEYIKFAINLYQDFFDH